MADPSIKFPLHYANQVITGQGYYQFQSPCKSAATLEFLVGSITMILDLIMWFFSGYYWITLISPFMLLAGYLGIKGTSNITYSSYSWLSWFRGINIGLLVFQCIDVVLCLATTSITSYSLVFSLVYTILVMTIMVLCIMKATRLMNELARNPPTVGTPVTQPRVVL